LTAGVLGGDPSTMGVTLVDATGRRTRFRPHPRRGFDQVVDLAGDGFRIEVTGIAIREVTITIRPSSALAARLRLVGAMAADVGRLGIRRRNLRTLFEMMRAGDWSGIGRRLDARYRQAPRGTAPGDSVIDAATWSHRFVELDDADRARLNDLVAARPAPDRPTVTFVLDATFGPDPAAATATIATQRWPHHDSTVLDGSLTLDEALDGTVGDWVVWLDPYGRLHEAASYAIAEAADRHPDAMVLVADGEQADDDDLVTSIRCNPPWNPDLVLGGDGAGPLVAVRRDAIGRLLPDSGPAAPTELVLRIAAAHSDAAVARIPHVLHRTVGSRPSGDLDRVAAEHLHRTATGARIGPGRWPGTRQVAWPCPDPAPTVSVLIPTRDRAALLERCLHGLYDGTDYPALHVVVVDHASTDPAARALLDRVARRDDTTVLTHDGPFNFAAMNNRAAATATGQVLCLLNNDTEVTHPGWLTELVGQVSRPEVGVAGALLRYPDGTVQHAGLHPGMAGPWGHGHKHFPGDQHGYRSRLGIAHRVAAVTGACLVTPRDLWESLDGLDEALAVAYNDVDYCLRVRSTGLQVVWTPFAELVHHESLSRGYDEHPREGDRLAREAALMADRWGSPIDDDPAYSPNLTLEDTNFSLTDRPRVAPPWRSGR